MTDVRHMKVPTDARISGHGLLLRPWRPGVPEDLDAWLRGLTDPDFRRWNTPLKTVDTYDDARISLLDRIRRGLSGSCVSFAVTDPATGTVLGHIGLNDIERTMLRARVGYWVLPEARGRRVAPRALTLAGTWAFTALGLHRIELGHAVGHDVSCRTAERCGFPLEGVMRDEMAGEGGFGTYRDAHLHARLSTDPEPDPAHLGTGPFDPGDGLDPGAENHS
ncbi:GNAT family N-acetyltransferase [Streptomyces sp. NPDC058045]|uniref:GNAT family N-acetyltransferase n=1 Tax=Streptomyces sp. NPDC058045 TaxID=3346311 RepID=UPI0036E42005